MIFLAWYVFALLAIALASGMFQRDDDVQHGRLECPHSINSGEYSHIPDGRCLENFRDTGRCVVELLVHLLFVAGMWGAIHHFTPQIAPHFWPAEVRE